MQNSKEPSYKALHVLVVDDSAVMRQLMTDILTQKARMQVTVAADPIIAMEKMKANRPNVILLDLEMPRMNGLTFLRQIMASSNPIPVIICSSLGNETQTKAIDALLNEGAVEVIAKPKFGVSSFLEESASMLIDTIKAAAQVRHHQKIPFQPPPEKLSTDVILPPQVSHSLPSRTEKIIAVGASTGGTEALRILLEAMPFNSPGIVIVQHMPEKFTAAFAQRLNQICAIEVKEAVSGDLVKQGRALIAPGNYHILLERQGKNYVVQIKNGPPVSRHKPSVNVLFRSVAQVAGANAIGVIMTGMGDDGAEGLLEMKNAGAITFAQDEASCVVFGMPKEAILRGAVSEIVPLKSISKNILKLLNL